MAVGLSPSSSFSSDDGGIHRAAAAKEFAMLALGVPQTPRPAEPDQGEHSKLKTRAKSLVGLLKRKTASAASTRASTAKSSPENSWKPAGEEPNMTEFFDG